MVVMASFLVAELAGLVVTSVPRAGTEMGSPIISVSGSSLELSLLQQTTADI